MELGWEAQGRIVERAQVRLSTLYVFVILPSIPKELLDPLANLDGYFTTCSDNRAEQRMSRCSLRVVLYSGVEMLQLVIPKLADDILKQRHTRMRIRQCSHIFELAVCKCELLVER